MLLSLERLREIGLLQEADLDRGQSPPFPEDFVDYGPVIEFRMTALRRAAVDDAGFVQMNVRLDEAGAG